MAISYADRVKETTTTTGTGDYDLGGAVAGFQSFLEGIGDGGQCYYTVTDSTDWEVGIGTLTDGSPDTLSRDTILSSSNGGSPVNWGAGSKDIFLTAPANIFDSRLLWEYEVTGAAVTTIDTGAVLDIASHEKYEVEIELYNPTGSTTNVEMFVNGDTTSTNYHNQYLQGTGTSTTAARTNNATVATALAGKKVVATYKVFLVVDLVSAIGNYFYDTASSLVALLKSWSYNSTVANVTQLTFTATVASSIGIGSKIRIYRGDR